ncbi:hypothetical protein [Roseofilum casamattae]|uniref:hypothetical protein n=1 Tax=Roseofilum casamattae TaxID=3082944 RepID=UPI0024BDDC26|nr:hypothetical protein [Roseofilum casamattae]
MTGAYLAIALLTPVSYGTGKPSFANPVVQNPDVVANNFYEHRGVMKFKLEDAGISVGSVLVWNVLGFIGSKGADWIRLEINGDRVRILHTTRTKNWLTQRQKWWDHNVRNIVFKPNSCTKDSSQVNSSRLEAQLQYYQSLHNRQLISEEEYNQLRQDVLRSNLNNFDSPTSTPNPEHCLVYGTNDTIQLPEGLSVFQGEFKIDYYESGEWKTVLFQVPLSTAMTPR